jgi:Trk K+ transport system NAD-binding subunit
VLFFVSRLLARLASRRGWVVPVAVVVFVFVTSWPLMALAEPAGSRLVEPATYWWYFVVTAATVGYGDFFPTTAAGHVVGAYVIVGGIATLTTVFARLASMLERAKGRRMQGAISVDASDHIVLLGYTPGRTDRIVTELLAESSRRVVLCAWDEVAAHPVPEQDVDFVRGELTEEDVVRRAGVHRAHAVLVDARDDNEALAIAVTVHHVNPDSHLVIALRDLARASLLRHVDERVHCVQWHTPWMITEELTSPGIAEVYTELMTPGGTNTYSTRLPESFGPVLAGDCQRALCHRYAATLLAVRAGGDLLVSPDWLIELPEGAVVYYLSQRRLTVEEITGALSATE